MRTEVWEQGQEGMTAQAYFNVENEEVSMSYEIRRELDLPEEQMTGIDVGAGTMTFPYDIFAARLKALGWVKSG